MEKVVLIEYVRTMSLLDNFIGMVINSYLYILLAIAILVLIRMIIKYQRTITSEYICPNCQTTNSERMPRSLFTKIIHLNGNMKKFKCLKCWKIYYVREAKQVN